MRHQRPDGLARVEPFPALDGQSGPGIELVLRADGLENARVDLKGIVGVSDDRIARRCRGGIEIFAEDEAMGAGISRLKIQEQPAYARFGGRIPGGCHARLELNSAAVCIQQIDRIGRLQCVLGERHSHGAWRWPCRRLNGHVDADWNHPGPNDRRRDRADQNADHDGKRRRDGHATLLGMGHAAALSSKLHGYITGVNHPKPAGRLNREV